MIVSLNILSGSSFSLRKNILEFFFFENFNISENNIISVKLAPKYYGIVLGVSIKFSE
jgi:hypothetical protein